MTLELGGKSPNIVFADADLDAAEAGVLAGIFAAGGQTCVAGSRALFHREIYDELLARVQRRAPRSCLGDPMDGGDADGPDRERAAARARRAHGRGGARRRRATSSAGGERASRRRRSRTASSTGPTDPRRRRQRRADRAGGGLRPGADGAPVRDEEEAIAIANDTRFGLAAGVWTRDVKRAHRVARQLQAGTVWINLYRAITFNSPFGGYKESGFGRVNGAEAIDGYLQTKSVWPELSDEVSDPFVMKI